MIQDNVGNVWNLAVAGHRNRRNTHALAERRVHGNKPLDRALLQQVRVFLDEVVAMAVAHDEVEVTLLKEVVFDAGKNERGVAFANLRNDNADGGTSLTAERPSPKIRAVVQFAGRRADQVLGPLRDRLSFRRAVDD